MTAEFPVLNCLGYASRFVERRYERLYCVLTLTVFPCFLSSVMAFLVSVLVTRLMILANIVDFPGKRSAHVIPTPRAGGVAVVAGFFAGAVFLFYCSPPPSGFSWQVLEMVAGACLLGAGVSFMDDVAHVPYRVRLFVQALVATAFAWVGLKIHCPPLEGFAGLPVVEFFLTLLFIIFVTNAANFVDGLNGLLSGSVLLTLPFMVATTTILSGSASGDYWTFLICCALFGSLLGFYLFNFPKGRIFLGDVGSVFIGLMVGVIALIGQKGHPEQPTWFLIHTRLFLLIYPLGFIWFDPVFTVIRRACLGRSPFEPNRDFLLHLLNRSGYSHAQVSGIYYASVVILGSLSLLTPFGYMPFIGLVIGYLFLQTLFVGWVFYEARKAGLII